LTTETGSFTDGTIYDCNQNMDYTWIIRPDVDDIEKISFDIRYNLAENDTVFVTYSKGNVKRIFTNDTSVFSADIVDTEIIVRLKTTNNIEYSGGISANYVTKRKIYCSGLKQFTEKQGTFDDGSGDSRYNNFTNCKWTISVKGASSITIRFSKFETEKDKDILSIIDLAQNDRPILATLSGILTDSVYTFQTNYLAFTFETDEKNIFQGWTLHYDTDVVNISNFEKNKKINIYPNPVNDNLFIEFSELNTDGKIQLFDIYGRLLKEQLINENISQLNLNDIASGIYVAKIIEKNCVLKTTKVVKK
jgi:hypothetical protein